MTKVPKKTVMLKGQLTTASDRRDRDKNKGGKGGKSRKGEKRKTFYLAATMLPCSTDARSLNEPVARANILVVDCIQCVMIIDAL